MKNLRKTVIALLAGTGLLAGCAGEQPDPGCYVQDASFANWFLHYKELVSSSGTCSEGQRLQNGESAGVFLYGEPGGTARLAIRPASVAAIANAPQAGTTNVFPQNATATSLGSMPASPDDSRFCAVSDPSPIDVRSSTARIQYQFENVRTYAGARSLGTQMDGRVTVTTTPIAGGVEGASCVRTWNFQGIWPLAFACDPTLPVKSEDDPATVEHDEAVDSCGQGSFMNQDVKLECKPFYSGANANPPTAGRCVAAGPVPSYEDGIEELEYADN